MSNARWIDRVGLAHGFDIGMQLRTAHTVRIRGYAPSISDVADGIRATRRRECEETIMTVAAQMLETYPKDLGGVDEQKLLACIDACVECAQACTACADACLSEDMVARLTKCIRTNADCADICATTGRVLSRHTGYDANLTRAVLEACAAACKACGDECAQHAEMHEHCRVCAEACRRCEQACRDLITSLG